jgi:DNA gyrase/topoisomerase IV subunit A
LDKNHESLRDFLRFNWGYKMQSMEQSLEDIKKNYNATQLQYSITLIENFLNDEKISLEDKNEFLNEFTEIYFPVLNISPVDWLKSVLIDLNQ